MSPAETRHRCRGGESTCTCVRVHGDADFLPHDSRQRRRAKRTRNACIGWEARVLENWEDVVASWNYLGIWMIDAALVN